MAFHLAERTDELIAAGATPEAARREAERRFGSYLRQRETRATATSSCGWRRCSATSGTGCAACAGARSSPWPRCSLSPSASGRTPPCSRCSTACSCAACPCADPQELARIGVTGIARRASGVRPPLPDDPSSSAASSARSWTSPSGGSGSVTLPDPDGTLRHYQAALVSGNAFALLGARPRLGRLIDAVRRRPRRARLRMARRAQRRVLARSLRGRSARHRSVAAGLGRAGHDRGRRAARRSTGSGPASSPGSTCPMQLPHRPAGRARRSQLADADDVGLVRGDRPLEAGRLARRRKRRDRRRTSSA